MIILIGIFLASVAIFCMMVGDFSWQNLIIGSGLTGLLMHVFRAQIVPRPLPPVGLSLHILIYTPVLLYYLFVDILKGTWQVVKITAGIEPLRHPGIIKYPIPTKSPYGAGPVGYFITLSPGSFLVDIDWEENVLLVHVLDASDPDGLRRDAEKYYRLWEYAPREEREIDRDVADYLEEDKDE